MNSPLRGMLNAEEHNKAPIVHGVCFALQSNTRIPNERRFPGKANPTTNARLSITPQAYLLLRIM